jgi:hypothetical protein
MPRFFVIGGFAACAGWRSAQRKGADSAAFVRARLQRLARPALVVFVFFAALLTAITVLPLGLGIQKLAGAVVIGVGSPLWFLAAYMVVQALAPVMIRWHQRNPWLPLVLLLGCPIAVDLFRYRVVIGVWHVPFLGTSGLGLGNELFGIPNVAFVWLFCQQLGFVMYDGWFARQRWYSLAAIVLAAFAVAVGLVPVVGYSWNLLSDQWPPTVPLALLGIAQAAMLTLLHRPLQALMNTKPMRAIVFAFGSRLMTIYLWHLPTIVALTGISLLVPVLLPFPGSPMWWWTRPVFFVVVLGSVLMLSLWLGRFERIPPEGTLRFTGRAATIIASVLFIIPPLGISAFGLDVWLAWAGLIATAAALFLVSSKERLAQGAEKDTIHS